MPFVFYSICVGVLWVSVILCPFLWFSVNSTSFIVLCWVSSSFFDFIWLCLIFFGFLWLSMGVWSMGFNFGYRALGHGVQLWVYVCVCHSFVIWKCLIWSLENGVQLWVWVYVFLMFYRLKHIPKVEYTQTWTPFPRLKSLYFQDFKVDTLKTSKWTFSRLEIR